MKEFHPASLAIFFASMILPSAFVNNPAYNAVLLFGAILALIFSRSGEKIIRELAGYFAVFTVMSLLNPLFVHRGATALFFVNGRAITLEAFIYGICSALRLTSALIWCRCLSLAMTSEKIFCLTGKLSPKISAVLSMTVRFIPDMIAQCRKISEFSRMSGCCGRKTYFGKIKRIMTVFSALVTWSIENAVVTADSMKARGFELGGRTSYSRFSYSFEDTVLIILSVISCASSLCLGSRLNIQFYPNVEYALNLPAVISASFTAAAAFLFPIIFAYLIARRRGGKF